jgi:hypothetical protein
MDISSSPTVFLELMETCKITKEDGKDIVYNEKNNE